MDAEWYWLIPAVVVASWIIRGLLRSQEEDTGKSRLATPRADMAEERPARAGHRRGRVPGGCYPAGPQGGGGPRGAGAPDPAPPPAGAAASPRSAAPTTNRNRPGSCTRPPCSSATTARRGLQSAPGHSRG